MSVIDDINNQQENNIVVDYAKKLSQQPVTTQNIDETPYNPHEFYDKAIEMYGSAPQKTAELQDLEKYQKRNRLIAGIGNMFSAFHTAYANARGVKPMVNPGESLSGKLRDRYDLLAKEHEMRVKDYNSIITNARHMDDVRNLNKAKLDDAAAARKEAAEFKKAAAEEKRQEREEKAPKIINNRDGSKDLWNPLTGTLVRIKDPDPVLVENIKSQTNRNNRSNSGGQKKSSKLVQTKDKKGNVNGYEQYITEGDKTTIITYDLNGKEIGRRTLGQRSGGVGSGNKDNLKIDENGNIILDY